MINRTVVSFEDSVTKILAAKGFGFVFVFFFFNLSNIYIYIYIELALWAWFKTLIFSNFMHF